MKLIMSDSPISLEIGENKDIKYIDLSSMKIANCVGCFGCWTFIRIHRGETHHVQRNVATKDAIIIAYGDTDSEEQEIFRQLVERNARNMNFGKYEIVFVTEQKVEKTVQNELKKWEK